MAAMALASSMSLLYFKHGNSPKTSCWVARMHSVRVHSSIGEPDIEEFKSQAPDRISSSGLYRTAVESMPPEGFAVLLSCAIGVFTGVGVVAFNYAVHEIHDIVWLGVPRITWLRVQPLSSTWEQIMLVPIGGGVVVGILNSVGEALAGQAEPTFMSKVRAVIKQVLKTTAAAVTLGTGNSLGPEGPSVDIGSSVAKGVATTFRNSRDRRLSLVAAGSAAGISSGFNAAIAGCFFAVESVLRSRSSSSLSTAMVLLSSVLASVVSQAGLGSDPAFKVAAYDLRSPAELPLYLLLGILCGGVSIALSKGSALATRLFDQLQKSTSIPSGFLPPIGGLCVAVIALIYPEVLYWGFENVDAILESRPWTRGPPAGLLMQLVGAKIIATSLCRGSRLVGGVYAPSLFIGAALGSAYGKLAGYMFSHADPLYHLDFTLQVASPQAYALVGMAATLAGVCQVPFTSVLLLFELTRDYRIILPLMAAVGLSSWIASSYESNAEASKLDSKPSTTSFLYIENEAPEYKLAKELCVASATRTKYLELSPDAEICQAISSMVQEKEWCVLVVREDWQLEGILTLGDIQSEVVKASHSNKLTKRKLSSICKRKIIAARPEMSLERARKLMASRGLRQLPVLCDDGKVIGLIDQESIRLACSLEATRRILEASKY